MKTAVLASILLASFVVVVLSDATPYYPSEQYELVTPEQAVHGHRSKRHVAAAPFLFGVAAGGIFGPILYNRLYGNNRVVYYEEPRGWSAPVVNQGWGSGGY